MARRVQRAAPTPIAPRKKVKRQADAFFTRGTTKITLTPQEMQRLAEKAEACGRLEAAALDAQDTIEGVRSRIAHKYGVPIPPGTKIRINEGNVLEIEDPAPPKDDEEEEDSEDEEE